MYAKRLQNANILHTFAIIKNKKHGTISIYNPLGFRFKTFF